MAAKKAKTETGTFAQRRTAENDAFRQTLRANAEQEAKDTARRLENNDDFRSSQAKLALAEAKAIHKS